MAPLLANILCVFSSADREMLQQSLQELMVTVGELDKRMDGIDEEGKGAFILPGQVGGMVKLSAYFYIFSYAHRVVIVFFSLYTIPMLLTTSSS